MENGLIRYKDTNWTFYNEDNSGLPDNQINCLKYDELLNHLWIGTENKGVVILDLNQENINVNENLIQNNFNAYFKNNYLEIQHPEKGLITIYNTSGQLITKYDIQYNRLPFILHYLALDTLHIMQHNPLHNIIRHAM